jgi:predicted exporter
MTAVGRRRDLAVIWAVILLVSALYCVYRVAGGTAFESNILGLMPRTSATGGNLDFTTLAGNRFNKRFIILLSHPDSDRGKVLARDLRDQLATKPGVSMASGDQAALTEFRTFFEPYLNQLLSPGMRRALQSGDARSLANEVFNELYSPVPRLRLYSLAKDPFNLGGSWLQSVLPNAGRFASGDIPNLKHDGKTWYIVRGQVTGNPFISANQQAIIGVVKDFATRHREAQLLRSGLIFHAAEAARIARFEVSTVGIGSLLGILLLVVSVFRTWQALAAIAFTLSSSALIALATSLAVFNRVHLVTVAFGSTLLGLAFDYCFHFLIKQQTTGSASQAGRIIRRGILLSAGSSITAYLLQLLSPFAGLQQFAVFMAAGLIGACGAVMVLARYYRAPPSPGFDKWLRLYPRHLATWYSRLSRPRWIWFAALPVLILMLMVFIAGVGTRDDIRLLNTSSQSLLDSERQVRDLLGVIDGQRYWLVNGRDEQQVLERSEELMDILSEQSKAGADSFISVAQLVPSQARQRQNHALVADMLYGSDGAMARLCAMLDSDCNNWQTQFGAFQAGLVPSRVPPAIASMFPVLQLGNQNTGVVLLRYGARLSEATLDKVNDLEGVRYVDQVRNLSTTLAQYRVQISLLLAVFIGLFALGCFIFYRRQGPLVLTCVLVSMAVSLASSAGGGLTLFHILGLLLVLGLSVDTAVFYLELGLDGESWLASTLAAVTSILAFGLLSLSQVPVLHYFGTVVFSGLLCTWLITPLFFNLWGRVSPPVK